MSLHQKWCLPLYLLYGYTTPSIKDCCNSISCWCIWRTGNGMQSVSGQAASTGTRTAHESAPVTRGLCSR
ncbi:unnamed protein product [Urochloa humidicola]